MAEKNSYDPSVRDVLYVKILLHSVASLPLELIDAIIDLAEYWPRTTTVNSAQLSVRSDRNNGNKFMLRSLPLGFIPGPDSESRGFGNLYNLTNPRPWKYPSQVQKDVSDQVISQLRSKFQPRGDHPCRKIVFTIRSHDQGWAHDVENRGTYNASFTWFDIGLEKLVSFHEKESKEAPFPQFRLTEVDSEDSEDSKSKAVVYSPTMYSLRTVLPHTTGVQVPKAYEISYHFDHPLLPNEMALQRNVHSSREMKEHVVTWSFDDHIDPESEEATKLQLQGRGGATGSGELVRSLVVGDVVTVWAKARFPGWMNVIEQVKIDVYWAV